MDDGSAVRIFQKGAREVVAAVTIGAVSLRALSTAVLKTGLKYGGWKDSFAWKFTPQDSTSTSTYDGSCHVPLSVTLATGATTYSQKTQTVCEYARGDALH